MAGPPVLITAPTVDVLTVDECKTMLGITTGAEDDVLALLIKAVVANIDPASGGWLGRALRPQTWELRLSQFPGGEIKLPYPVMSALTSVKHDDSDGAEQTLVEGTDYRVFGLGGFAQASVAPVYGGSWPSARYDKESVRIRYVCGYDGAAMPQAIKYAVALGVRQVRSLGERNLFLRSEEVPGVRSREWTVSDQAGAVIEKAIRGLLTTYWIPG